VSVVSPWELGEIASVFADRRRVARRATPAGPAGLNVAPPRHLPIGKNIAGRHANPVYGLRTGGPPGAPLAIGLSAQDIASYYIEYVVGGTHWPMYVEIEREAVIRDYHRQNMFLATHPLVDIVAHPWWWMKYWQAPDGMYRTDPWFDDFRRIPQTMHDEFAAAAIQHGTVVEINLEAMLLNRQYTEQFRRQYVDYLAYLQSRGVILTAGSDCHDALYQMDFETGERMLASVGIRDEHLWRPEPRLK